MPSNTTPNLRIPVKSYSGPAQTLRSRHEKECHPNVGILLMGNRIKGHLLSKEYMATDESQRDY